MTHSKFIAASVSLFLIMFSSSAFAQTATSLDQDEHLLDGISFTFQNQNADAADISLADGNVVGKGTLEPFAYDKYVMNKLWDVSEKETGFSWSF